MALGVIISLSLGSLQRTGVQNTVRRFVNLTGQSANRKMTFPAVLRYYVDTYLREKKTENLRRTLRLPPRRRALASPVASLT